MYNVTKLHNLWTATVEAISNVQLATSKEHAALTQVLCKAAEQVSEAIFIATTVNLNEIDNREILD